MNDTKSDRLTWLHISDIHFHPGTAWRDNSARKSLLSYLETMFRRNEAPRPDLIFCTGDIAFGHASAAPIAEQYDSARSFFEQLRTICGDEETPVPIERLFVVPGNHDVNRRDINALAQRTLSSYAEQASQHAAEINHGFAQKEYSIMGALARLDDYARFVADYLPHQSDVDGRHFYGHRLTVNGIEVGIAGFNSAWSCAGDEDDRLLWLAADYQFGRARDTLEHAKLRIGLVHHPIDWLNQVDREIARYRIPTDFDFWLHGHSHSAWVEAQQTHVVIGAGAVGAATQDEFGINLVSLDLRSGKGIVQLHDFSTRSQGWKMFPIVEHAPRGEWSFDLNEKLCQRLKRAPGDETAEGETDADDALSEALVSGLLLAVDELLDWAAHAAFQLLEFRIRTYFFDGRPTTVEVHHQAFARALKEQIAALDPDLSQEERRQVVAALERAGRQPAIAHILCALLIEHQAISGDHLRDLLDDRIGSDEHARALLSDPCCDHAARLLSNVRAQLATLKGFHDVFDLAARLTSADQLGGFSRKIANSLDRLVVQHEYLRDEAKARNLDELQTQELSDYLECVRRELALLKLPVASASAQDRPPSRLYDIFVPLQLREVPKEKQPPHQRARPDRSHEDPPPADDLSETEIGGALAMHGKLALLAPVGSGKTTLLRYAALAFAEGRPKDLAGWPGGPLVPIFIRLRSFASFLKTRQDFGEPAHAALIAYLSNFYMVGQGVELGSHFFRNLLKAGRCGLFFDGLDEVPFSQRDVVAAYVDNFIEEFRDQSRDKPPPKIKEGRGNVFLLSSRPKGYEPVAGFLRLVQRELKPLDPKGIRSLVRKILAYLETDRNVLDKDFAELSRVIEDRTDLAQLAATPLFCSSLVQVYKIGAVLPARRVDVLDDIVTLLLGVWKAQDHRSPRLAADEDDIDRDLELHNRITHKRRRLAHIALNMQLSGKRTEIDFPSLVEALARYLRDREGAEDPAAERLARRFVDESHERSGLLNETDPSERRIFAFSHEGFREFLVAEAMLNLSEARLTAMVLENIDDPAWEEVIVLVAASRKLSDAAREHLLEECAAAAERRLDEMKIESWARHLTVVGHMVRDMDEYLPPHLRVRYQATLLSAMVRRDCPLTQRCGLALGLDEIGWRAPGTFGFGPAQTSGDVPVQMALHPVTNGQYRRFLDATDFSDPDFWEDPVARMPGGGVRKLNDQFAQWWSVNKAHEKRVPKSWHDPKFGIAHPGLPVVGISWFDAVAYCRWLERHWTLLEESRIESAARGVHVRLPKGREWDFASGLANCTSREDLPFEGANVGNVMDQTVPVGMLNGAPPGTTIEAIGNVWEWQAEFADRSFRGMALRGGSFATGIEELGLDLRGWAAADTRENDVGFRILIEFRRG